MCIWSWPPVSEAQLVRQHMADNRSSCFSRSERLHRLVTRSGRTKSTSGPFAKHPHGPPGAVLSAFLGGRVQSPAHR